MHDQSSNSLRAQKGKWCSEIVWNNDETNYTTVSDNKYSSFFPFYIIQVSIDHARRFEFHRRLGYSSVFSYGKNKKGPSSLGQHSAKMSENIRKFCAISDCLIAGCMTDGLMCTDWFAYTSVKCHLVRSYYAFETELVFQRWKCLLIVACKSNGCHAIYYKVRVRKSDV